MEDSKRNQSIKERMQQKKGALTGKIKLKRKSEQKPVSLSSQTKVLPSSKNLTEEKQVLPLKTNKVNETNSSSSEARKSVVAPPVAKKLESQNIIEKEKTVKEKDSLNVSKNKGNDSIIVSRPKTSPVSSKKPPTTYSFKKGSAPQQVQVPPSDSSKDFSNKRKKDTRNKKDANVQENTKFFKQSQKKNAIKSASSIPKEISIMENIQVSELAKKMNLRPNEIIAKLMKMGTFATINNVIDSDTATLIASEYNCNVKIISLYEQTLINSAEDLEKDLQARPPVVTIMGHVDHGKTKLLDVIRRSTVIDSEAGGITQHIGAYQVQLEKGSITFLDTPGHEAFTSMRARGASVTDIVVLVVAANDGVMPQTIEAINHAKEAKVPIIVAINKIDIEGVNPEKIIEELASHGLQPEDWGGDTIICKISAKENIGISELLEMILLKAETMELKANPNALANGIIIESKLDVGKGASITVLVQNGTLKIGDPFVAGVYSGRVRAMFSDTGEALKKASLSYPVQIIGSSGLPTAGSPFNTLNDEKQARQISKNRQEYEKIGSNKPNTSTLTIDNMTEVIKQGSIQELKIVIKADVDGSKEAIKNSIEKLSTESIKLNVIHSATGAIIESDVILAKASNATIVGFNVKANSKVSSLAQKEQVEIHYYSIIYDLIDSIRDRMEGMLEPEIKEESMGELEVREIFKISKLGNIAGCLVVNGKVNKGFNIKVFRDNAEIFNGKIKNLKRLKEDVNQVENGFECGLLLDGFNDLKAGDRLEVFKIEKIKRKL